MSDTFQPDDPNRYRPGSRADPAGQTGGPARPGRPPSAFVRGWTWGRQDPRPGLPWIGLALVLFGGLLLLGELVPGVHIAGPALGVAIGLAFLIAWLTNRGRWGLYPGIFVLAISLPGFLIDLGLLRDAPGWSMLFLGLAMLAAALVRLARHGRFGWLGVIGGLLAVLGAAEVGAALVPGVPSLEVVLGPLLLLSFGLLILLRSAQRQRR